MSSKIPNLLSYHIDRFMNSDQSGRIMFCKQYKAEDIWDIAPGAVLDLQEAQVGLVEICNQLYSEDQSWFIGDIQRLHSNNYKSID